MSKRRKDVHDPNPDSSIADALSGDSRISPSKQLLTGSKVAKRTSSTLKADLTRKEGGGLHLNLALSSTSVGHVFVVGSGDCAQLGLGPDVFEKERPAKIGYFDDREICKVVAGGLHTLALSLEGKVIAIELLSGTRIMQQRKILIFLKLL